MNTTTNGASGAPRYDQRVLLSKYAEITKKMYDIIKSKNSDYAGLVGDAFANFDQIELLTKGMISREMGTVVRMSDKLSRVVRLLQNSNQVLDEKIEDTLLDLANYSILLVLMLSEERECKTADPLGPAIGAARSAFANSKSNEWLAAQGAQDAIAEHVLELTERR